MEKKIIAVALVLVLMVTAFVGCTKGKKYVDEDGNEHLLVLDKEGSTVLNDNGKIVVYATEADGDIKKDDNGEPMTALLDFPEMVVEKNTLETPYYRLTLPETWKLKEDGEFVYKENENISISILKMDEVSVDDDLTSLYNRELENSNKFADALKKEYPKAEVISGEETKITMKNIKTKNIEFKIIDDSGSVMYYANTYYFIYNNTLFQICLVCDKNSYNDTLNLENIADRCLVMKRFNNE